MIEMTAHSAAKLRAFVLQALLALIWASCRPAPTAVPTAARIPDTATATQPATVTQPAPAPTGTAAATSAPTEPPGRTPEPAPTDNASPAPTATPVPNIFAVVIQEFAQVYNGPSAVFERIITLTGGMSVDLIGRDAAGDWYYVDLLLEQGGWISSASVRVEGDPGALQVVDTPAVPTATSAPGSPPVIFVRDVNTLVLQNFKLHENVILTVVQVENPETAESRNCVISDPEETLCPFFNRNRIGVTYRITAQGDQGSFAETIYTREE
jgi:hypothetical protein